LEEAVLRNIDACKELAETTRSAYGPYGMTFQQNISDVSKPKFNIRKTH